MNRDFRGGRPTRHTARLTAADQETDPLPKPTMRVLSLIAPMTQLNTPYPSTAYLTGFLRSRGVNAVQEDLALALVLRLFSPEGLTGDPHAHRGAAQA